jgi:hypothetical protein
MEHWKSIINKPRNFLRFADLNMAVSLNLAMKLTCLVNKKISSKLTKLEKMPSLGINQKGFICKSGYLQGQFPQSKRD